eukprot:gene13713-18394_t
MAEAGSWASMVKSIEKEKKVLPWKPEEHIKVERVSLYERKRQEREYDPITTQYRDPIRNAEDLNNREQLKTLRNTKSKEILAQKFNFINHTGPPRQYDTLLTTLSSSAAQPKRNYHVLSNLKHGDHLNASLLYDEEIINENIKKAGNKPHSLTNMASFSNAKYRDFDLISNHFKTNHEERIKEDYEKVKDHVLDKYWKTHDYDFIKGEYYDEMKEKTFKDQREIIKKVQGESALNRLPTSLQVSEGNSYNIVNHTVYDEQRLRVTNTMEERSQNRLKGRKIEARLKDEGDEVFNRSELLKTNKISFKRWENDIDRGYDNIKNQLQKYPDPIPVRPVTMWTKLSTSTESLHGIENNRNRNNDNNYHNNNQIIPKNQLVSLSFNDGYDLTSGRPRDLSGRLDNSQNGNFNNRAQTTSGLFSGNGGLLSERSPNIGKITANFSNRKPIPSLNLESNIPADKVTYVEPTTGPLGMPVPMIRTGGLSSYRD